MLEPKTTLTADPAEILRHLTHITRRWGELGQPPEVAPILEIVYLSAADKAEVKHVSHYRTAPADLAEAARDIAAMNKHQINAYCVVNPLDGFNMPRGGQRASRDNILASFYQWADADDAQAAENIRQFVGPKCTFHVLTGTQPSMRPHVYWELEQPAVGRAALDEWEQVQKAIAATLKTDPSVTDSPRIMRIAGTVNWPKPQKQKKGYIPEVTTLRIYDPAERPPVTAERMQRAFSGAQQSLSAQAMPRAPMTGAGAFEIDTGGGQSLDRERMAVQALSGVEWHNAVIRLVGSYVAKGLNDAEIHGLTAPLTLPGYTTQDTAREVQTAIDGARRKGWTPETYASPAALQTAPAHDASDFDAPRRPSNLEWFDDAEPALGGAYIVKGVLDAGAMSVIYGPSNSGKTFFAFDLAYHVAIGAKWRNRRVAQTAVLYLAAEGGNGAMNRMAALKQEHGVCDVPLALKRAGLDLLHDQADLQHIADLAREVKTAHPDKPLLIVIDTLSRIMAGGDENSAADMTALIRNVDAVREATGAHIMLVHHTGKDTARGARGHSSLRAATDTEIEVSNENGARAAMVTKQRDHRGGETFAFALKSVVLGTDTDGDDVTSCVVESVAEEEHAAAVMQKKGLGGNQKIIADAFDQMLGEGLGVPNMGGVGMPEPGKFWTVDLEELRRISREKMFVTDTRSAFNQAMKALTADRGLFVIWGNTVWRTDRMVNK